MAFQRIQEYLNTDDGVAGQLLIPRLITMMVEEVDKNLIPRELAAWVMGPSQIQGSSFYYNLEDEDTMDVRRVEEGAEVPLDSQSYSATEVTPVKYGVSIRITREMMEDSQFELLQRNIRTAGKRFAELETSLILTALDGANATTAGGAAITIANIAESMFDVEDSDYTPTDMLAGNEVVQDLRNIDTFVEADKLGSREMLERGFVGKLFGLNVIRFSTNAAPSSTYAKYAYIFDREYAYGLAIKRDLTVENFNLPTFDMQGALVTMRIAATLIRSKAVSKITTA